MEFEIAADGAAFYPENVELRAEGTFLKRVVARFEEEFGAAEIFDGGGEAIQ